MYGSDFAYNLGHGKWDFVHTCVYGHNKLEKMEFYSKRGGGWQRLEGVKITIEKNSDCEGFPGWKTVHVTFQETSTGRKSYKIVDDGDPEIFHVYVSSGSDSSSSDSSASDSSASDSSASDSKCPNPQYLSPTSQDEAYATVDNPSNICQMVLQVRASFECAWAGWHHQNVEFNQTYYVKPNDSFTLTTAQADTLCRANGYYDENGFVTNWASDRGLLQFFAASFYK